MGGRMDGMMQKAWDRINFSKSPVPSNFELLDFLLYFSYWTYYLWV